MADRAAGVERERRVGRPVRPAGEEGGRRRRPVSSRGRRLRETEDSTHHSIHTDPYPNCTQ